MKNLRQSSMIDFEKLPKFKKDRFEIVSLIPEWAHAYQVPEEAIADQLAWAHGWISSNPKKAPKRSITRFLFNWLRKAKEYGNLRVRERPASRPMDPERDMTYEEMVAIRKANMARHV